MLSKRQLPLRKPNGHLNNAGRRRTLESIVQIMGVSDKIVRKWGIATTPKACPACTIDSRCLSPCPMHAALHDHTHGAPRH
jgi:hypothetical protein